MFTGIIELTRPLSDISRPGRDLRLSIEVPPWRGQVALGESICVLGVCLTVSSFDGSLLSFDLSPETLSRTRFAHMRRGDPVNLERALRLSDRLGGHLVMGHVDGLGEYLASRPSGGGSEMSFRAPPELARYLISKGSIAVDGISLTLAGVAGETFTAAVIPHTLQSTHLESLRAGQAVHLEVDVIGKWIERLLPGAARARRSLGELLGEAGYLEGDQRT